MEIEIKRSGETLFSDLPITTLFTIGDVLFLKTGTSERDGGNARAYRDHSFNAVRVNLTDEKAFEWIDAKHKVIPVKKISIEA